MTDHQTFKISCRENIATAFPFLQEPVHNFFDKGFHVLYSLSETLIFHPFFHTKYNETPIKKNKNIHTGEKTQLGGAMLGFFKLWYQDEIAGIVKKEPIIPAVWHIITEIKNFAVFIILYIFYYKKTRS